MPNSNNLLILVIAINSIAWWPATYATSNEICEKYQTLPVMGGAYIVQNNVWGATTPQCVIVPDTNVAAFAVSQSGHNNAPTKVAAYPSIFRGCHWGNCTVNSGMPVAISRIASAPFTWSATPASTGSWSIAAEAWFSPRTDSSNGYDGGAELMIWLDSADMQPAGDPKGTIDIGGTTWEIWYGAPGVVGNWTYIAYRRHGVSSVNLDLKDFIEDARSRGYLDGAFYLHDLEAGTEIISGGANFVTKAFAFTPVFWSEPLGVLVGTPNNGYSLDPLYGELATDPPIEWTELDEAPGYMGVAYNTPALVAGVRFYSYPQSMYWNHIAQYRVMGQKGNNWVEVVPSKISTGSLPGWEEILFPVDLYNSIKVEYTQVSPPYAPRVGELQFGSSYSTSLTVTPSAGSGGTFTPNTAQTVDYGATQSFTVTPDSGYMRNPNVSGSCPQGSWNGDVWTTGAITANCTVKFIFTQVYTVTPSTSTGGSLSPNTPQIINTGTTAQFTLTANTGYTRDNAIGGTCPQGSWNGDVWTTGAITSDCNVVFSFTINTYVVTPSTDLNGSLTPNSVQMVNYGATASFTATPNSGYTCDSVVTGTCPQGSWNGNVWTTGVITAACTVKFAFLPTYTVTPIINLGGTITPNTPQTASPNTKTSFTVVPKAGYINSKSITGTCPLGSWSGNVWTTGNITANCTVKFNFLCLACMPGQGGWRAVIGH